jgi:UDP-N-acetyl-D-mannosaminuronic acid dehydrogenase
MRKTRPLGEGSSIHEVKETERETPHAAISSKVKQRTAVLGFVGMGYVGLPVSLSFAAVGFTVRVHDVDKLRVDQIERGELPFGISEPGLAELFRDTAGPDRFRVSLDPQILAGADVYFLAIDTPILDDLDLDASRFLEGVRKIARYVRKDTMVVVESTVPPGTIDETVVPELEKFSGLKAGRDFLVLHCPERLRPGRLLHNLRTLGRLVGGDSEATRDLGMLLYQSILPAKLTGVDYRTAEVAKTAENAVRDVQIALANQLAIVCDFAGVDVRFVRAAVNQLWQDEPLVLEPGAGVGGHCLPKDPWLLVSGLTADQRTLIAGARALNSMMPRHVVSIATSILTQARVPVATATVAVLGVSYNNNTDDTRNSPGLAVADLLRSQGVTVRLHDPGVTLYDGDVIETLRGCDLAVVINSHLPYAQLDLKAVQLVMRHACILDTRRCLDGDKARALGLTYRALGIGALHHMAD